jgi:hypothetical protein
LHDNPAASQMDRQSLPCYHLPDVIYGLGETVFP